MNKCKILDLVCSCKETMINANCIENFIMWVLGAVLIVLILAYFLGVGKK